MGYQFYTVFQIINKISFYHVNRKVLDPNLVRF